MQTVTTRLLCSVAALGLGACAAFGPADARNDRDAGPFTDGPVGPPLDQDVGPSGLWPDAGAARSDGGPSPRLDEAAFADDDRGDSCFNFADDDGNGQLDCEDPSCASPSVNVACCVASTAELCCTASGLDVVAETATCAGAACLGVDGIELVPTLGQVYEASRLPGVCTETPGPGFAPIGTAASHGYLALPSTYDPAASYLRITGRIGVADDADAAIAAAGFGLFAPQGVGAVARPLVGVAASATSDDVRVIVGDRVIAQVELSADDCGRSYEYEIALEPDGEFAVRRRDPTTDAWGEPFASGTYDVTRAARVAMFGQQPNPMAGGPRAWVSDLSVAQSGCDLLAPARRTDSVVAAGAEHDVSGIAVFPHAAGSSAYEALVTSGDLVYWMGVRSGDGVVTSGAADPFSTIIAQPTSWTGYSRLQDIEVLVDAGVHHVFVAAASTSGTYQILHAEYSPGATPSTPGTLGAATPILGVESFTDATSIDGITALRRTGGAGIVLAVRARYADGHTEIRIAPEMLDAAAGFEAESPSVIARSADGITTDGLVHASQALDETAFDRDEVADPQLVEIDGIVRVLYAGRRGTRWAIGMIVASPDFTHFAPAGRQPVLAPSGSGFDALGVSEPQLVRRGGTDWLYFAGSDGARRSIGLATQPVVGTP